MDLPRSGGDKKVLDMDQEIKHHYITYTSTLARDLEKLGEEYKIESVQAVDMFSRTEHVETIALLAKS